MSWPLSYPLPPMKVEYTKADPEGLSFVTKASPFWHGWMSPQLVWNAPNVVGKLGDLVVPVTYALPALSAAMPFVRSSLLPPRYVEYTNVDPAGLILATKESPYT